MGRTVRVSGRAEFVAQGASRIVWTESGVMHARAGDVPVAQTRILVAAGDDWQVLFSDGRPFHDWSPGVSVSHACAPDEYRGIVSADAPGDDWTMRWQAVGPAKDYTIDTVYRRAMS